MNFFANFSLGSRRFFCGRWRFCGIEVLTGGIDRHEAHGEFIQMESIGLPLPAEKDAIMG